MSSFGHEITLLLISYKLFVGRTMSSSVRRLQKRLVHRECPLTVCDQATKGTSVQAQVIFTPRGFQSLCLVFPPAACSTGQAVRAAGGPGRSGHACLWPPPAAGLGPGLAWPPREQHSGPGSGRRTRGTAWGLAASCRKARKQAPSPRLGAGPGSCGAGPQRRSRWQSRPCQHRGVPWVRWPTG